MKLSIQKFKKKNKNKLWNQIFNFKIGELHKLQHQYGVRINPKALKRNPNLQTKLKKLQRQFNKCLLKNWKKGTIN